MELETVVPDRRKKMTERERKNRRDIKLVIEDALRVLQENSRKVEKARELLHAAGKIDVGVLPYEVVDETRLYKLLHYRPLVSRAARTPILVVYALMNKSYI